MTDLQIARAWASRNGSSYIVEMLECTEIVRDHGGDSTRWAGRMVCEAVAESVLTNHGYQPIEVGRASALASLARSEAR